MHPGRLPYYILLCANAGLLLILLIASQDNLREVVEPWRIAKGILLIAVMTVVAAAAVLLFSVLVRKWWENRSKKSRLITASLIAVFATSWVYYGYIADLVEVRFDPVRVELSKKVHPFSEFPHGYRIENMDHAEYAYLGQKISLPILHHSAENVYLSFSEDGFLPDYKLEIIYELPPDVPVNEFNYEDPGQFYQAQVSETDGNKQVVTFTEIRL